MVAPMGNKFTQIDVMQSDIDKADLKASSRCVVATAIARTYPDATRIEVDLQTIRFTRDGERFVYVTPYAATGYIVAFDAGEDIHPFSFRLNHSNRVGVHTKSRTPAGKKVSNAVRAKKAALQKLEQLDMAVATSEAKGEPLPPPVKAQRKAVAAKVQQREEELAEVKAAYASQAQYVPTEGKRLSPPRINKTGTREYGQRRLRINQESQHEPAEG